MYFTALLSEIFQTVITFKNEINWSGVPSQIHILKHSTQIQCDGVWGRTFENKIFTYQDIFRNFTNLLLKKVQRVGQTFFGK